MPPAAFAYLIPLCNCACEINSCQSAATSEGRSANARHPLANRYDCQTAASIEGRSANARHAVRDCYAR